MSDPKLEDFSLEIQDLAVIAKRLVTDTFRDVLSLDIEIGEDEPDGMPIILVKVLVSGDVYDIADQYVTYQERWREACPEIYQEVIRLAYDIKRD